MVDSFNIPHTIIISVHQTPLPYCLINSYTMEKKGSKYVTITESADQRQITGTFCMTLSGIFLPIQSIQNRNNMLFLKYILLLSGDIYPNPGPVQLNNDAWSLELYI